MDIVGDGQIVLREWMMDIVGDGQIVLREWTIDGDVQREWTLIFARWTDGF